MNTKQAYRLLLVDDDAFLLDMYSLKFTQGGHIVDAVGSADEALKKLREPDYEPDAILLDLVMPKINGFELMQKIQEEHLQKKALLIVLSNQGEDEDIERAKEYGAVGHIIKANAIPSEVLEIVEGYLRNRT